MIYVMAGAVIVSALALVLQLLILYGLYRTTKSLNAEVLSLLPGIRKLMENAENTLSQSRKQILDVTGKASDVLDLTRAQLTRIDESMGDVLVRMRGQLERAEGVVEDSLTKVHETVSVVHSGVVKPLREISGVAAGIRAAVHSLARGTRTTPAEATHDDEMFI
jgi:hypothetical protein